MPEYCTIKDVRYALTPDGDKTDKSTAASLPDAQIEDAINEAEDTIRAFIASRYKIVIAEVEDGNEYVSVAPKPLRGWCRDLAAFLAALTFRRNKDLGEDDPIRLRWAMVMGFLKDVRDGKMDLDLPGPDDDTDSQGVHVENLYQGKLFGMEDVGLGYDGSHTQRFEPYRNQWS